jgi:hypothetical protein
MWLDDLLSGFKAFCQKCDDEAKKLLGELPAVEQTIGTDVKEVAALISTIAPDLEKLDAIVKPFLKSAQATKANASALAILTTISSTSAAVSAIVNTTPTVAGG